MTQQHQVAEERLRSEASRGHYVLELVGILAFFVLAFIVGADIYVGMVNFGNLWLLPVLAVLAYLAADLLSGFVHFLADNFGSAETPIIGPNFIGAFREHHVDPKGITHDDFVDTNGNNSLVALPFMLVVWLAIPIETTAWGYLFGAFSPFLSLGPFLPTLFPRGAHMHAPRPAVAWLQGKGLILSSE